MLRPSTSRGLPALGCADSGRRVTASIRSIVSSIGAGPTAQLTPITVAPAASSSGANRSGGVPSSVFAVLLGRHLRDDRQVGDDPDGIDGGADLVQIAEGLEDEQIDAALEQRLRLLAEVLARLVDAGLAPRLDADAQRTDRAGHVRAVARRATRDPRALDVDLAQRVGQAERAELDAVRAERVRLDDVGAGADVLVVDLLHQVRPRQVQRVEALVDEHALRVEHRPHRAVADEDALGERVGERQHELIMCRAARTGACRRRSAGTTW